MQQNTQEWLDFRKGKIGASDAPVIMGLSPWMTPLELYNEKVLGKERPSNWAMERGKELEPKAREMMEKMLLIKLEPKVVTHPEHEWMIASLDGISEDGKTAVEIKCPSSIASHLKAMGSEIPDHYQCQMQHQMAVTGLKKMIYGSYFQGECEVIELARDEKFINSMIKKEKEFFDMMMNKTPPEGRAKEDVSTPKSFLRHRRHIKSSTWP
jgi:putative phage-type endonuclease